jgi:hypothetical protein
MIGMTWGKYTAIAVFVYSVSFLGCISLASALELCVGARPIQKLGYCKYEYEAYFAGGDCQARTGGWYPNATITLQITSPNHLHGAIKRARRYANLDDRTAMIQLNKPYIKLGCSRACATVVGTLDNGRTVSISGCNKRSYD